MSRNSFHQLSGLSEVTKAKQLTHTGRHLSVVGNDKPNLRRDNSFEILDCKEFKALPLINEYELQKKLNSLCNDKNYVLDFLRTEGKDKKQQIDEYKQLIKDINIGIKFNSNIPGLPDIETLKDRKKSINKLATSVGIKKLNIEEPSLPPTDSAGIKKLNIEEPSLPPTDEKQVNAFEFNEYKLRKTLNSLCNDKHYVLDFLQTEGKDKKQQIDEYKQLIKDINNGIKFNSNIPGLPDIETLKDHKKLINKLATSAGIKKLNLDIVKDFFNNNKILGVGVALAGLAGLAGSIATIVIGAINCKNDDGEEEVTEEIRETKNEIDTNQQEINKLNKELDSEDKQKLMEKYIRISAEKTELEELERDPENVNNKSVNGHIIDKELKPEAQDKVKQAGDNAVTEYQDQQKNIQRKIDDLQSEHDSLQDKLKKQKATAPHRSTNKIGSEVLIGIGSGMLALSLFYNISAPYYLKRKIQKKIKSEILGTIENKKAKEYKIILENNKNLKLQLGGIKQLQENSKKRIEDTINMLIREERSKHAKILYSILKGEEESSKSIPKDSSITKNLNSSETKISD